MGWGYYGADNVNVTKLVVDLRWNQRCDMIEREERRRRKQEEKERKQRGEKEDKSNKKEDKKKKKRKAKKCERRQTILDTPEYDYGSDWQQYDFGYGACENWSDKYAPAPSSHM